MARFGPTLFWLAADQSATNRKPSYRGPEKQTFETDQPITSHKNSVVHHNSVMFPLFFLFFQRFHVPFQYWPQKKTQKKVATCRHKRFAIHFFGFLWFQRKRKKKSQPKNLFTATSRPSFKVPKSACDNVLFGNNFISKSESTWLKTHRQTQWMLVVVPFFRFGLHFLHDTSAPYRSIV